MTTPCLAQAKATPKACEVRGRFVGSRL